MFKDSGKVIGARAEKHEGIGGPKREGEFQRFSRPIQPHRHALPRITPSDAFGQVQVPAHGFVGNRQDHVARLNSRRRGPALGKLHPIPAALHCAADYLRQNSRLFARGINMCRERPFQIPARHAHHADGQRQFIKSGSGQERAGHEVRLVSPFNRSKAGRGDFQQGHVESRIDSDNLCIDDFPIRQAALGLRREQTGLGDDPPLVADDRAERDKRLAVPDGNDGEPPAWE